MFFSQAQSFAHDLWRWPIEKFIHFSVELLQVARVIARVLLFLFPLGLRSQIFQFY